MPSERPYVAVRTEVNTEIRASSAAFLRFGPHVRKTPARRTSMDGWTRALVVCCVATLAGATPARANTETYTSGCSAFAVPVGVGSVTIAASGAKGADGLGSAGGTGDTVTATLGISYPETLYVCTGWGGGARSGSGGIGGGASGVAVGNDFS